MRSHQILYFLLVLTTAVLGCSSGPTSAGSANAVDQARLQALWAEGQNDLAQLGERWVEQGKAPLAGDVFSVGTSGFHFVAHDEPLTLRGEPVGGYFDANNQSVHFYQPFMDGAVQHEVGHAVLYVLADPRWRCAFHENCEF